MRIFPKKTKERKGQKRRGDEGNFFIKTPSKS
jgi:hypothetical protein